MRRLRYAATCCVCQRSLPAGADAHWDPASRAVTCAPCADDPASPAAAGVPGRSAGDVAHRRREHQRAARACDIEAHPVLGRLRSTLAPPKDAGRSWATGQVGEQALGAALDALRGDLLVLHDRRLPRSQANIDHLVVAPAGVWVIDAKRDRGRVAALDRGGWFRSDVRLTVAGRDRTRLVEGVRHQVRRVEAALPGVPVHGALCFVDADWALFAKPFAVDGVLVTWGKALRERLTAPGSLDHASRVAIQRTLAQAFPPP